MAFLRFLILVGLATLLLTGCPKYPLKATTPMSLDTYPACEKADPHLIQICDGQATPEGVPCAKCPTEACFSKLFGVYCATDCLKDPRCAQEVADVLP